MIDGKCKSGMYRREQMETSAVSTHLKFPGTGVRVDQIIFVVNEPQSRNNTR